MTACLNAATKPLISCVSSACRIAGDSAGRAAPLLICASKATARRCALCRSAATFVSSMPVLPSDCAASSLPSDVDSALITCWPTLACSGMTGRPTLSSGAPWPRNCCTLCLMKLSARWGSETGACSSVPSLVTALALTGETPGQAVAGEAEPTCLGGHGGVSVDQARISTARWGRDVGALQGALPTARSTTPGAAAAPQRSRRPALTRGLAHRCARARSPG